MNNHTFLKAAAVAAGPLVLCAAVARATPITAEKRGTTSATHVAVDGGVGIGQFQDIQVPVNEATGMRADGTPAQDENGSHIGVPMHIGLAVDYRPADLWDWTIVRFDALQMTATSGSSTTQAASYSRLGISTELERQVLLDGLAFSAALRAGARRSGFANVSTSHYIEAALVGGALGVRSAETSLEVYGGVAPWARFGFSDSAVLGGHTLPGSSVSLSEVGAKLGILLRPGVWFETGLARESARVTIPDISQYQSFGLSVLDTGSNARAYDLETMIASVGIRKEF